MELVTEWLSGLRDSYSEEPLVSDVRVGVFYTAVKISTGDVGVAFTPRDLADTVCCPKSAAGAPPAGRLVGVNAWQMAQYALSPSALRRSVGIATLNALTYAGIKRHGLPDGVFCDGIDALDAAWVGPDDEVAMVGAFVPFIKALKGRVAGIKVIDKHRDALKPEEQALWMAPERAAEALERASVAIFSGSTLVEGAVEELLSFAKGARVRLMAGPTTPLWPRPFFRRGIAILGGIRVLNGGELLTIVGQGGSGYFFESTAVKTCVVDRSARAGLALSPRAGSRIVSSIEVS
jgi:uncharacterized protein (DUF4213/DUF364 family)